MANPVVKIRDFLAEVTAELKKSAWPTRRELTDSTIMVIVTVLILGLFVAFADLVFVKLIALLTRSG
ncbi:MAG: preprotein translocase subunit SecE [Verrucomicrobiia bacterium]|jgi:preprotein translocase subunit SecE